MHRHRYDVGSAGRVAGTQHLTPRCREPVGLACAFARTVVLPYDTAVGDSAAEVLAAVPGADGEVPTEGPFAESFVITTEQAPGVLWLAPTRAGDVVEASAGAQTCD